MKKACRVGLISPQLHANASASEHLMMSGEVPEGLRDGSQHVTLSWRNPVGAHGAMAIADALGANNDLVSWLTSNGSSAP